MCKRTFKFELQLISYWQNIKFSWNCPKFHIFSNILIFQVYLQIFRPTASSLNILWQGHVSNTLFHFCQLWAVNFSSPGSAILLQPSSTEGGGYHYPSGPQKNGCFCHHVAPVNCGIIHCGHFSDFLFTIRLLFQGVFLKLENQHILAKICKIRVFETLTSLKCHCDIK